ncbi:MAG TPA: Na-translocating system protein MpsC family protein [Solirubrobacterales bacterium]|nr:Na-translocating system protein MpsC family protein [Solirubrobacterales bacterium]
MDALRGITRGDLEQGFASAFAARTDGKPESTTVVECDDMLMIRAHGTLTKSQGVLASRDPALVSELSRAMLDDLAHEDLWRIAEELTGETVIAVLTDQSVDPDIALVCFVLGGPADA